MPTPMELHQGAVFDEHALAGAQADRLVGAISTYDSFAAAEAEWRAFESTALATAYQRYDWLEAWYRHVGAPAGIKPLILVARTGDGAPALLWPLGVRASGPARVACWLGGKYANYKLGLYDRRIAPVLGRSALMPLMSHLREEEQVDALALTNQPEEWQGVRNPLTSLPHQPSPSFAYSLALQPDFEQLYQSLRSGSTRKKLRRSERRIADEFGSCELRRAQTSDEVDRVLDSFFLQKTERMREKHIANAFAGTGVMAFLRELAERSLGAEEPLLDLFWIDAGGRVAATWAGTAAGGRMSGLINSFDLGVFAPYQPGEVLLRQLIEHCCRRGFTAFDLGVGEAQYKSSWCPSTDRLFDSFLPLTAIGWVHTTAAMTGFRLKRAAKQSQFLRALIDRLR